MAGLNIFRAASYYLTQGVSRPRRETRRRRKAVTSRGPASAVIEILEDRTLLTGAFPQSDMSAPSVLLNEVFINPGGIGGFREVVEIISTTGGATSLDSVWFLAIDGDAGGAGFVEIAVDLSGKSTGTNGLMLLGNSYDLSTPWPVGVIDAATTRANLAGRLSNFTVTFMLVTNFTGEVGRDLDLDNNGVIDGAPFTTVLDAIATHDGGANDHTYTTAVLSQPSGRPDAATRFLNNTSQEDATAWYTGDINTAFGRLTRDYDDSNASANLPAGAQVTPGSANTLAPPMVYVNDDFTDPDGTFIIDADPNSPGDQNATIGVNAFDTIQEGVDAADPGATVVITDDLSTDGAATYVENVVINKSLSLASTDGSPGAVTIDGNATASVLTTGQTTLVTLTALILQNGAADDGAGIRNLGTLNVIDSVIQNNVAGFFGGGIENQGTLFMDGSHLLNNSAGVNGGALRHASSGLRADLKNVLVDGNTAGEEGGGIWNSAGGILITRGGSTISANIASGPAADQGGGGIYNNGGRVDIQVGTTIRDNAADGAAGSGGGILSINGIVTLDEASVLNNQANRAGGGIEFVTGTIELTGSNIYDNSALGGGADAPGNGGGLHVTGSADETGYIRLLDSAFRRNTAAKQGGAIWNQAGNIMTVTGTAIRKNTASGDAADDGGGGIFNNGGRLAIADVTFIFENDANGVEGSGGGIFSMGGAVTIESNTNVLENHANRAGGGLEFVNADVIMSDTLIYDNTAGVGGSPNPGDGGGMHVTGSGSTIVMHHVTVRNNQASRQGGGLWNDAGSSLTVDSLSDVIDNAAMGNGATDGGGGIYNAGTMTVGNSTISGNTAANHDGGGVFNDGGLFLIHDSMITDNHAGRFGGGFENRGGDLRIDTNETTFNSAGVAGGGVHVTGTAQTVLDRGQVSNNTAGEEGGGLWNSAAGVMKLFDGVNVNENVASGNDSDQGGGGIFNDGVGGTGGRLILEDIIISRNIADGTSGSGGGILSINGVVTLEGTRVLDNTANRAGGGIELVTGILEMTAATVDTNDATGGGNGPGNGGGVHVTGLAGQVGRINVINTSVSGNTAASEGGGLWNQAGNIMVVRGGSIINGNTASGDAADDGGGGIFNNNGRLAVGESSVISNNTADGTSGSGGGIFSMGSGVSIDGGTTITGNAANRAGGGIEVVNGVMYVIDTIIENNNAGVTGTANPGDGGGLHISGTSFTRVDLRNSIVQNNQAAQEGGGLWNQTNGVMLVRIGTQVTGNTASGDAADNGGGGIFSQGRLVINNATIDDNHADGAAGSGGGIFNVGGVTTIENATVSNNSAHRAGGGIEVLDGWIAALNVNLTDNDAGGAAPSPGNGGGLHVSGAGVSRVTIEGGTISGNTAASEGGGLWLQTGSITVFNGGTTISGNTASGDGPDEGGGGIFNNGGRLAITAITISGNAADGTAGAGGGILSLGGGLTLDNSTLSGNTAAGDGGGIAIQGGELIAANATIVLNRSDSDGAGGGTGGGLHNGAVARLKNTIVAGNLTGVGTDPSDVAGNNLHASSAHDLIGDAASAGGLIDGINGNIVGNAGSGVLALATILDPTLAGNGGPTFTHALAVGSPAINTGNNALAQDVGGIPFTNDQRGFGFPRIIGGTVDMGAVEV